MDAAVRIERVIAWKIARSLAREIGWIACREPLRSSVPLRDHILGAAITVMSRIAESWTHERHQHRLLTMARRSLARVRSGLYVALDQDHLTAAQFDRLDDLIHQIDLSLLDHHGPQDTGNEFQDQDAETS